MHRNPLALRHIRNPRQRRAQIPLHIHRQRFQRRNIKYAATFLRCGVPQHQPVQAPKKSRQRLARPSWCKDQRRLPPRNRRPALSLRRRHILKHCPKPGRSDGMKQLQHIRPDYRRNLHCRSLRSRTSHLGWSLRNPRLPDFLRSLTQTHPPRSQMYDFTLKQGSHFQAHPAHHPSCHTDCYTGCNTIGCDQRAHSTHSERSTASQSHSLA